MRNKSSPPCIIKGFRTCIDKIKIHTINVAKRVKYPMRKKNENKIPVKNKKYCHSTQSLSKNIEK